MNTRASRIAIVTGCAASRSIGRAIALRLASDGFDLTVNDLPRRQVELNELVDEIVGLGRRAISVAGDVSHHSVVSEMISNAASKLGSVDVVVANAGISEIIPLLDVTPDSWDRMMAINARSVFLTYQAAARQMIAQGRGGKIIGAASIVAHRSDPLVGPYSASKHAVRGLTQAAAQEWAKYGITVNAYCPGITNTTLWDEIDKQYAKLEGIPPGQPKRAAAARAALGKMMEPEDIASLVSFLASSNADVITGQAIIADGGINFA